MLSRWVLTEPCLFLLKISTLSLTLHRENSPEGKATIAVDVVRVGRGILSIDVAKAV